MIVYFEQGTLRCQDKNNCIIMQKTRVRCSACRLKKCLSLGMNPKLIRQFNRHEIVFNNLKQSIMINQNRTLLPGVS